MFSAIFSSPRCKYPMSGVALVMISPSSSSTMRKTPCVAGCEGPMLSTMRSSCISGRSCAACATRAAESLISMSWTVAMELFLFDRPRPLGMTVRFLDFFAPFQSRHRLDGIGFRDADARFARHGGVAAGDGDERSAFHRRRARERHARQLRRLAGQREILAQREMRITFPHEDAARVRMPAKMDPHHV